MPSDDIGVPLPLAIIMLNIKFCVSFWPQSKPLTSSSSRVQSGEGLMLASCELVSVPTWRSDVKFPLRESSSTEVFSRHSGWGEGTDMDATRQIGLGTFIRTPPIA